MTYKSILTVLTDTTLADGPIEQAVAMADRMDAHVEAFCLGVDRTQAGSYYAGANALVLQDMLSRAQAEAVEILEYAKAKLAKSGVRWNAENGVAQLPDLGRQVAMRAQFCDVAVLAKPYGPEHGIEIEPVVEAAMFEGHAPVIVVPDGAKPNPAPETIVVAWNESDEALRAIRLALPILQSARHVRITVIDPPAHSAERSDPGGPLSQMLARHGVTCEIDVLSKTMPRISDVLNRHVSDQGADMLVMGAYGHSRLREAILGGATRNMLELANVPVLMAH